MTFFTGGVPATFAAAVTAAAWNTSPQERDTTSPPWRKAERKESRRIALIKAISLVRLRIVILFSHSVIKQAHLHHSPAFADIT